MMNDNYNDPELDNLYSDAVNFVTESRIASISAVQRRFKIGYNRASAIIEAMQVEGIISSEVDGSRVVLAPAPIM